MVVERSHRLPILFVLMCAIVVLAGCGDDGSEPAAPTAVEEEEPAAPTTTAPSLEWSRVAADDADLDLDGEIIDLAAAGPGFVAVGSAEGRSAVWTSTDGVDWTLVPGVPDPSPEDMGALYAVTAGGPGAVAVSAPGPFGLSEVLVLGSSDGSSWTQLGGGDAVFGDGEVVEVTAGGPGLVAVGSAVWTSPEGRDWTRVTHDEATSISEMADVVTGGPGLVAVGDHVWTSPDGLSWTRAADVEGQMSAVTVGGPGFVAVGQSEGGAGGAIWTSTDGTTWTQVSDDQAIGLRPGEAFPSEGFAAVVSAGPRLVAIGERTSLWTSTDGFTWTEIPKGPGSFGFVMAAVADGSNVIVVGIVDERPAVWQIAAQG
ncbi:MAG: hypothetical protein GY720_09165 [bacterium]|nr:hypothetical protein [bacterium]